MTAEHIHDALNHLPEELLEATDALRQKKRTYWRSAAALAACACLVVGVLFFFPDLSAKNSAEAGSAVMDGLAQEDLESCTENAAATYITAQVVKVESDRIWVTMDQTDTQIPVYLEGLEKIPELEAGQQVRIYCNKTESGTGSTTPGLHPYKIELEENT